MLRLLQKGDLLDHAVVGPAVSSRLAGAPILLGQSVDDALHIPAAPRAEETVVHPIGGADPPNLHKGHRVSRLQKPQHRFPIRFKHSAAGRVSRLHQERNLLLCLGPVEIYGQLGAVAPRQVPGRPLILHG